jgi:hypothetical protein
MKIEEMLKITSKIYGVQDNRLYDLEDHFYFERKFLLRFNKAKKMPDKINNFLVSLAWYLATINRFNLDLEKILFKRYSYKCPFCLSLPCYCDDKKDKKTQKVGRPTLQKPKTINEWQLMIKKIYPNDNLEKIILEIFEKQDELHYLYRTFRKTLGKTKIKDIEYASADYFVLVLRLFNLFNLNLAKEFKRMFGRGCYICHKAPCQCYYFE